MTTPLKRSHLISGLLLFFLTLLFCLCPGPLCALVGGQMMAFGVLPQYPTATLVSTHQILYSNTSEEKRIYKTDDSLDTVLLYMEQRLPGFMKKDQQPSSQKGTSVIYLNTLRPSSLVDLAVRYADLMKIAPYEEGLPWKTVLIYSDPDNPSGTIIEVISGWWTG